MRAINLPSASGHFSPRSEARLSLSLSSSLALIVDGLAGRWTRRVLIHRVSPAIRLQRLTECFQRSFRSSSEWGIYYGGRTTRCHSCYDLRTPLTGTLRDGRTDARTATGRLQRANPTL